jgi:hypothetical protein
MPLFKRANTFLFSLVAVSRMETLTGVSAKRKEIPRIKPKQRILVSQNNLRDFYDGNINYSQFARPIKCIHLSPDLDLVRGKKNDRRSRPLVVMLIMKDIDF